LHERFSLEKGLHGLTKKLEKGAAKATSLISKPPKTNGKNICLKNSVKITETVKSKKDLKPFDVPPVVQMNSVDDKNNDVLDNIMKNEWLTKSQRKTLMEVNEFFRKTIYHRTKNSLKKNDQSVVKKTDENKKNAENQLPGSTEIRKEKNYPDSTSRYSGDFRWWYMMRTYPDAMTDTIDYDEDLDYYLDRLYHWQQRDLFGESKSDYSSNLAESVEVITQRVTEKVVETHPTFNKEFHQSHKARLPQDEKPIRAQINRIRAAPKSSKKNVEINHQDKSFWKSTKKFFLLFVMWLTSFICCQGHHQSVPERKGMKLKALRQFEAQYSKRSDLLLKQKLKALSQRELKRVVPNLKY
jgi:hypothetical protein